jgi:hypothetical protein
LYKLVRYFRATKVFTDTARKCAKQLLGILTLMLCLVILFAIMLYQVERGRACFIGEDNCSPPSAVKDTYHTGDRILLNKNGDLSQFPDVFYGLWFSFVTLTTTGYGDIVPVTNTGQVMTVFLMLAGSCYLSMPLTVSAYYAVGCVCYCHAITKCIRSSYQIASSTFFEVHEQFLKKRKTKSDANKEAAEAQVFAAKAAKDTAWKRRLILMRTALTMSITSLDSFMADLQAPSHHQPQAANASSTRATASNKSNLLQRSIVIVNDAKSTLSSIGRDLEALALTSTTIYNKQPKDTSTTKHLHKEASQLIVC